MTSRHDMPSARPRHRVCGRRGSFFYFFPEFFAFAFESDEIRRRAAKLSGAGALAAAGLVAFALALFPAAAGAAPAAGSTPPGLNGRPADGVSDDAEAPAPKLSSALRADMIEQQAACMSRAKGLSKGGDKIVRDARSHCRCLAEQKLTLLAQRPQDAELFEAQASGKALGADQKSRLKEARNSLSMAAASTCLGRNPGYRATLVAKLSKSFAEKANAECPDYARQRLPNLKDEQYGRICSCYVAGYSARLTGQSDEFIVVSTMLDGRKDDAVLSLASTKEAAARRDKAATEAASEAFGQCARLRGAKR